LGWLTNKLTKGKFSTLPTKFKDELLENQLNENLTYSNHIDYKRQIRDLTKYMLDKGMNIKPLPKVVFYHGNVENAKDFFGKTAYYNPNTMEIVLYTEGRHPKDVVRSFSHEMIHHIQNIEDRLGNISTINTNEDDHLTKLEAEANLKGTMTFRNWTDSLQEGKKKSKDPFGMYQFMRELLDEETIGDSIKCDKCGWMWKIKDGGDDLYICHKCGNNNTPSLNEGKYDTLTNQISSDILRAWKQDYDSGFKSSEFYELYDFGPYGLEVEGNIEYKPNKEKLTVDGGADDSSRKTPAFIKADFIVDPKLLPDDFPEIAMNLKDVIRHEIEHITQSGRAKAGKYTRDLKTGKLKWQGKDFADDQLIRNMINMEFLPKAEYFKLEKEVDANLQGMYLRAKKERRPFRDVIDDYLDAQKITPEEKEEILDLWRTRLPALNLPKF
jgi:hypothetical protein